MRTPRKSAEGKSIDRDRVIALARQIFEILPEAVTGLQFYILDCGCIYFQQVFEDGRIDPVVAVYRETGEGPCDVCTLQAAYGTANLSKAANARFRQCAA